MWWASLACWFQIKTGDLPTARGGWRYLWIHWSLGTVVRCEESLITCYLVYSWKLLGSALWVKTETIIPSTDEVLRKVGEDRGWCIKSWQLVTWGEWDDPKLPKFIGRFISTHSQIVSMNCMSGMYKALTSQGALLVLTGRDILTYLLPWHQVMQILFRAPFI